MLFDFNMQTTIDKVYDICIVGTGPAGITLARKLAQSGKRIILLEAGGLDYSEQSQNFYECESVGNDAWPKFTRLRYFGGTSNHWSGRCRPFDSSDFDSQKINGLPGWPIRYSALEPYLREAMEILDLNAEQGFQAINDDFLNSHFNPDAFSQSPPTRFKAKYQSEIEAAENIDSFYHATAIDLELDQLKRSVHKLKITNYKEKQATVKADKFILCLGGIETPRFLLNCNKQMTSGVGNATDMVGRCFMEHLNVPMGSFIYRDLDNTADMQFYADDEFVSDKDIGKSNISLGIVSKVKSYGRTKAVKNFFKNIACQMEIEDKVQFISDFKCPGMGNISTLLEQSPNLDSRVSLSHDTDDLGINRAKFDWQISDYDRKTIRETGLAMAKEFSRAGLGVVRLADFMLDESIDIQFGHHAHHMGTTRMSDDPRYGVVDKNSKVHDIDNLYVAGSSVFSTGGACNPTMPIVQLSLRLADHLSG
ncbi:6'''-hydroxyparomomycin C oxidase [Gammaproteobacteria bacterium MOLA455]|nr:6'''-hydroxyparomomycin C oxidase [Gammaproteobacteria bacterium MOLA455]